MYIVTNHSGTIDMQLINTDKTFICKGFCDNNYHYGQKVFVTYNFPDGNKFERILCITCAKLAIEHKDKYGYIIGNIDEKSKNM